MGRAIGRFLRFLGAPPAGADEDAAVAYAVESEDAFTRHMATRFRAALPATAIEIAEPLQLRVGNGRNQLVNLGRMFKFCAHAAPEECEESLAYFVATVADMGRNDLPLAREQLRLVVRSSDSCNYLESLFPADGPKPEMRLFLPGVGVRLVAASPGQTKSVTTDDLAELGLEPDAAWALALRQTLADLPEPESLEGLDDQVLLVAGFPFVASLILNEQGWRAAAAVHGELLGAVPADDTMLVVRRARAGDVERLKAAVLDHFETAERGVSPLLYRWTDKGWALLDD